MQLDKLKGFDPCFHGRRLTCPHVTGWPQNVVNGCQRSTVCSHVTKWPSEAYGRMKATDFPPRPRWNVNEMWILWNSFRIPKLHRNSLSRKVFGDTQWRTYQEFGELCKACRAETGSNFPCEVCPVGNLFFKHVDFRTLELVCERLAWSPFPKLHCCWTEDVRRYNAGLFSILEFNFVWFSGNLRLSRILDDSSKRLCWELHIYAARKRPQPEGDFDSLTGKFKIMMYEACVASLEQPSLFVFGPWRLWDNKFEIRQTRPLCVLTWQDTCADWQVCA